MTIFYVELIYAIILDANINNTKVYLHVNIELMILKNEIISFFEFRNKNETWIE